MRTVIVSAGDDGYFSLLKGLALSVLEHRPAGDETQIAAIDVGLTGKQLDELHGLGVATAPGRWPFEFPAKGETKRHFQAQICRPFLPDYFSGYDLYVWIDADAWLQDWRAIELLKKGAVETGLAVVPEIHPLYPYLWRQGLLHDFTRDCYLRSFGAEWAQRMAFTPIINSGVFAIHAGSPWWGQYAKWLEKGFAAPVGNKAGIHKWTEQCALNLACRTAEREFRVLPAWANWVCRYALPVYDAERRCLCDAMPPFDKLSIIHLTGVADAKLERTDGKGKVEVRLDYLGFKGTASDRRAGS